MALGRTSVDLWRRAPAFRFLVFGAAAMTILAILLPGGQSGGNSVQQQQLVNQGSNPTSPSGTPGGGQGQGVNRTAQSGQPQTCGPQGQTTRAAPVVVSQSGQVPSNVSTPASASQSTGPSAGTTDRFRRFSIAVNAAMRESRAGETCQKMDGALGILDADAFDYAYADCFPEGVEKLELAQQCAADLGDSNARFDRLIAAANAADSDGSAVRVERLAQAQSDMAPFDQSRERWKAEAEVIADGQTALARIEDSDRRIAELEAAASAASAPQPAPAAFQRLADAGRLTALDRGRLSPQQSEMLSRAASAKVAIQESETRLSALSEAVSDNAQNSDENTRDALITAVSRLTPFDAQRATAQQSEMIETARNTAAGFAMRDLVASAQRFDPDTLPPSAFERLRDLRSLVLQYGGVQSPTAEEQAALDSASRAGQLLKQSDSRLDAMREMVELVREGGPAQLGEAVLRTHDAITAFDISRMDEADKAVFEDLKRARDVTLATERGLVTKDVPIFITTGSRDPQGLAAYGMLEDELQQRGFALVPAREQSAVSLTFSHSDLDESSMVFTGGTKLVTAEMEMELSGEWTFAGEDIVLAPQLGRASGARAASVRQSAMSEAVEKLVDSLEAMTTNGSDGAGTNR